jgi:glycosyltransferase involved in cell wall biosynthesis
LNIVVLYNTVRKPAATETRSVISLEDLRRWVLNGSYVRHLFKYDDVELLTCRVDFVPKPFLVAPLLKLMSRRNCTLKDEEGQMRAVTAVSLARSFSRFLKDLKGKGALLRKVDAEVEALAAGPFPPRPRNPIDFSLSPAYLRTDLWFGVPAGGSVGHIAGVLNHLDTFCGKPVFLSTDAVPTIRQDIETRYVHPDRRFWDFGELPSFHFNETFLQAAQEVLQGRHLSFFYQRYSLNNYSGLVLARRRYLPFVLEYNGSEIWINRNWGMPLKYEALSIRIEMVNLSYADLIVVVSKPMKDELVGRGIEPEKILVNPNGVDPERYSPDIDGSAVRKKYGMNGKLVIGFIGTFGKWHGAEVLAEAFGLLLEKNPRYRETLRLLMVGDGVNMPLVRKAIERFRMADCCILTGLVPQEEGPGHLAACDILASPHVPNPDGTPFFGSPTKLFEYMAMEKGVVASELDQIGEILEHGRTAWLVEPGDVGSLVIGLKGLVEDEPLRKRLGEAARREAVEKYTWKEHTRKIIEKLRERCGES